MFPVVFMVFLQTVNPQILQLKSSINDTSPGLEFRPMPPEPNADSSLIWYRRTDRENVKQWTDKLDEFLEAYRTPSLTPGRRENLFNCDYGNLPPRGQVCDEDVKNWTPCISENHYNYDKSSPCVFLKLNKINGWIPEYYNETDSLPDNMPQDLKTYIKSQKALNPKSLNTVWVSCKGENPADVENIEEIEYIPRRGFPGFFFPFENSKGYLSPLVALHFVRPMPGILINIECKAWAKNHIRSVHFELLID